MASSRKTSVLSHEAQEAELRARLTAEHVARMERYDFFYEKLFVSWLTHTQYVSRSKEINWWKLWS